MSLFTVLLALTLALLLMYFVTRGLIKLYINSVLKKGTRKSLAKGQNFREWFTYSRYKRVLPISKFIWYYGVMTLYVVSVIVAIILFALGKESLLRYVMIYYFVINVIPIFLNGYLLR